jgi:hypothetical protein
MESLWWHSHFLIDRCRISILDGEDKVVNTIDVDPIYANEEVNEQRVLNVSDARKTTVSQNLLQQRLGHRATSALLLAQEDKLWSDATFTEDKDHFCETCRITTARKANRGATPIEDFGRPCTWNVCICRHCEESNQPIHNCRNLF